MIKKLRSLTISAWKQDRACLINARKKIVRILHRWPTGVSTMRLDDAIYALDCAITICDMEIRIMASKR